MVSDKNPVSEALAPSDIDRSGLKPEKYMMKNGQPIYYFVDNHFDLIRIDIVFEAGSAKQSKKLQAFMATKLLTEGTRHHTATEIADFMDYRGIIAETKCEVVGSTLTVYTHSRHIGELLPMLREIITEPIYPQNEFDILVSKRRQKLQTKFQETSYVARNLFYENLYGTDHPIGRYALPQDLDLLSINDVRLFNSKYMKLNEATIIISGNVTDDILRIVDDCLSTDCYIEHERLVLPTPEPLATSFPSVIKVPMPNAVQNTLRVGRLLPFAWNDIEYAQFKVLSTLLGGYFGSRLMSSLREEKGYTYGIYSITSENRGTLVFSIITDVAADKADVAMDEILNVIDRVANEPVSADELHVVRNCMIGDFLRSVDGVFERGEHFGQMIESGMDETFTDNYFAVLSDNSPYAVTPERLSELARTLLRPDDLVKLSVGSH
ncbi:MAG: insulinase family protein [Bacteroidales bacterium]|nr:insulinase family protein [Bacteroidales bacterium]